ncbi:MAG: type IV pilus assembly protein PilM, partial [Nitrospirales bacterium]
MLGSLKQYLDLDIAALLGGKRPLVGLDLGSSAIKLVQIKEVKGRYILQKFGIKPLEPEVIVDGTVMDAGRVVSAIRELFEETDVKLKTVATSISGHSVIIKKIILPPMPEEELDGQVRLAAEQYIPFDINEVSIDFHILNPAEQAEDGQPQMSVLLVAAKKDKINELTELLQGAGLTPMVLDVDAFAIENMYGINYAVEPEDFITLVNIGASVMNINVLKGGTSAFTRDVPVGGNRYTEAIQRDLGVSYEEAESAKLGQEVGGLDTDVVASVIEGVNAEVASEIARSVDYFRTTFPDGEISKVVLC